MIYDGGLGRCMKWGLGPGSCCAWNGCPMDGLPEVGRHLGEVYDRIYVFGPVLALIEG